MNGSPFEQSAPTATTRPAPWWPLLATLVAQGLLVWATFPGSQLWSAMPILGIDHPYHLYQIHVAQALAAQGRLTGYDPFFSAGYLGGVTFNASAKGPALLAWLLRGTATELQAYKLYVAGVSVLAPAIVVWAARAARATHGQVWLAAALAIGLWWASGLHWYQTAGLVSFVFVSFVAVAFCVALNPLFDAARAGWRVLLLGLVGALAFVVHPLFAVPVSIFCAVRLLLARPTVPLAAWTGRLAAVGALCLLPNLPWLLAMTQSSSIAHSDFAVSYQTAVDHRLVWMELLGLSGGPAKGAKVYPLLALLAVWSVGTSTRARRAWCVASIGCWSVLVLFAAFGAALPPLAGLQPNRFSASAYVFLIIPAALGCTALAAALRGAWGLRRAFAFASAAAAAVLTLACADEVRREATEGPQGRYGSAPPDVRGVGPKGRALLDWLATDTRPNGRVLFETSMGRIHDGGHIVGYLALQSGREFIGGPYNNFFAGTRDGWMFGRPLESIAPDTFRDYLRLYNIGWIVVHSVESKRYLSRLAGVVRPGRSFEGLQTYAVDQPLDFVHAGHGEVLARDYGRLLVEQRGAPGERIVLKYHFVPGLRAADGSAVEPVWLMDDPQPFIALVPRNRLTELSR